MNTPTTRDFLRRADGTRRRSARQALAVIPVNNSASPGDAISTEVNAMDNFLNSRHGSDSWSPAPSPDELVIQKRGRRRRTIVWSPDDTCKRNSLFSLSSKDCTPVKSPSKTTMILRSTPRKRLALGDANEPQFTTPEKKTKSQSSVDINSTQKYFNGNLMNGLRALSHDQLVQMIMDLVTMQEDGLLREDEKLRNILLKKMPVADIQPLIDILNNLKQNIKASFGQNVEESASNHGHIHLDNYQKAIIDQGKRLVDSQHWISVMHYVYAAWNITKQLREWKNESLYNLTRKCFKTLTHFCSHALKKGNFSRTILDMFADRFDAMVADYEDLKVCLQLINEIKNGKT